jgi:methanogenic corrinoid protein MtbC1
MSLLSFTEQEKARGIAEQICERENKLAAEQNRHGFRIPLEGLTQTVVNLELSVLFEDREFFSWSGFWSYLMMADRIPGLDREQVRTFDIRFCEMVQRNLWWLATQEQRDLAFELLDGAIDAIRSTDYESEFHDYVSDGPCAGVKKDYLQKLLANDTRGAMDVIFRTFETMTFRDICTQIVRDVMYQVGELWLYNKISVAQEHYCTAATQSILAMLYPRLARRDSCGKKIVVACVGSELHEMGARIVSDLFEEDGWDSVFLGAALPVSALLSTVEKEKPDLCAVSVALPQGIPACLEAVENVRKKFPGLKIAIGGHAFAVVKKAPSCIGADIYAPSCDELLAKARELC